MADDSSRFYEGILNPGGGLYTPSTVEDMYRGIIPASPAPSQQLTTRSVQTVPINPFTGSPVGVAQALNRPTEAQMRAIRDPGFDATRETMTPGGVREGQGYEAGLAYGPSYRLLPNAGTPAAVTAIDQAAPRFNYQGKAHMAIMRAPSHTITPSYEPTPIGGQNLANSMGKPVRAPSGKVYTPMPGYGPPATASAPVMAAPRPAPTPSIMRAPNGYVYSVTPGQTPVRVGTARPAGMTPAQQYAIAAAPALDRSAGYTPSSSGQSNDYFSVARSGGSEGGIEGNGGITGYY